jgi:hypothetical protein
VFHAISTSTGDYKGCPYGDFLPRKFSAISTSMGDYKGRPYGGIHPQGFLFFACSSILKGNGWDVQVHFHIFRGMLEYQYK